MLLRLHFCESDQYDGKPLYEVARGHALRTRAGLRPHGATPANM